MAEQINYQVVKFEYREDKYGQTVRAIGPRNIKSNWHTSKDNARIGLYQKMVEINKALKDM